MALHKWDEIFIIIINLPADGQLRERDVSVVVRIDDVKEERVEVESALALVLEFVAIMRFHVGVRSERTFGGDRR